MREQIMIEQSSKIPEGCTNINGIVFPSEWEVCKLSDVLDVRDGTHDSPKYVNHGIPFITSKNLVNGKIDFTDINYISEEDHLKFSQRSKVEDGDILFAMIGTIGNAVVVKKEFDFSIKNVALVKFSKSCMNSKFVWNLLRSNIIEDQFRRKTNSAVQKFISLGMIRELYIPVPSKTEQDRIVDVLTTWDKAIELKEKLIEEKKKQKSGLMQKLLTGKVRLPGFDGEWEYKKANIIFANISDKKHGGIGEVLSATQDNGILPRSEIGIDIKFEESSLSSYKRILKGDFVISLRSFQGGIEYSAYDGLVSPAYTVLRNKLDISHAFYKNFFKSTDFITRLNGLIYGIRDGKQIGYKDFSVLELPYPDSKEQVAIGEIIELADKEIKLHKKELEALKRQKKGLMQLLLTGIVRVNVEMN